MHIIWQYNIIQHSIIDKYWIHLQGYLYVNIFESKGKKKFIIIIKKYGLDMTE